MSDTHERGTGFRPLLDGQNALLCRLARERAAQEKISYRKALHDVCFENQELARSAREEVAYGQGHDRDRITGTRSVADLRTIGDRVFLNETAGQRLSRLARQRSRENGVPFRQALIEMAIERPELSAAARNQALKG